MKSITIYSTPTCHFCKDAKAYLDDKGIVFTDVDVAKDLTARKEMIENSGQMGVPVIAFKDGEQSDYIVGYNEEKLKEMLTKYGFTD